MQYTYKTKGTCSQMISFAVEDGKVSGVQFFGGCNGNLKGIASLVEGMDIDYEADLLPGPIGPGSERSQERLKRNEKTAHSVMLWAVFMLLQHPKSF